MKALWPACLALLWAGRAWADAAQGDDGELLMVAGGGTVLLLVAVVLWRVLGARREKAKPDSSAFMTLEQMTRLESPDGGTLMKTVQPRPLGERTQGQPRPMSTGYQTAPSPSDVYKAELEKQYPRIVEKLVTMWPSPDAEEYIRSLTFDDRGDREGFSREIATEIMMLYAIKAKAHRGPEWS